jgi:Lipocalin-like domain
MFFKKTHFAIVLLAGTIACKKEEAASKSPRELLIGNWQTTAQTTSPGIIDYNGDGIKDEDSYSNSKACEKDNFVTFKEDGQLEYNEGPLKCSAAAVQIDTHSWSVSADGKILTVDIDKGDIVQLTATTLKLHVLNTINGVTYTVNTVMAKR